MDESDIYCLIVLCGAIPFHGSYWGVSGAGLRRIQTAPPVHHRYSSLRRPGVTGRSRRCLRNPYFPAKRDKSVRMEPEFNQYADKYRELLRDPIRDAFAGGADFFHVRKWRLLSDFLRRRGPVTKGWRWLDIGSGQGELLRLG